MYTGVRLCSVGRPFSSRRSSHHSAEYCILYIVSHELEATYCADHVTLKRGTMYRFSLNIELYSLCFHFCFLNGNSPSPFRYFSSSRLANDAQIPHVITQARRVLMRRMRLLLGGREGGREGAVANSEMASGDKWGPLLELHTNGKKDMVMDMGRVLRCVRTRRLPRHTCCKSGQARTMSNRSIFDLRFTRNIKMNVVTRDGEKRAQSNDRSRNYAAATSFPSLLNLAHSAFLIEWGRGAIVREA